MTTTAPARRTTPRSQRAATKLNAAAMLVAIVGIATQIAAGVDHPPIPPGPITLGAAVVLMAFTHFPWAPLVGVAARRYWSWGPPSPERQQRQRPEPPGRRPRTTDGTIVQHVGVVIALISGLIALRASRT